MNKSVIEILNDPSQAWLLAPGTPDEAAIVQELQGMPMELVRIGDSRWLEESGMRERRCHANCVRAVEASGNIDCHQVIGWIVWDGVYLLHSVLDIGGERLCVTPNSDLEGEAILFIADGEIEEIDKGNGVRFYQKGVELNYGVRANPAYVVSVIEQMFS